MIDSRARVVSIETARVRDHRATDRRVVTAIDHRVTDHKATEHLVRAVLTETARATDHRAIEHLARAVLIEMVRVREDRDLVDHVRMVSLVEDRAKVEDLVRVDRTDSVARSRARVALQAKLR